MLSGRQWDEWAAFWAIEPWGDYRADRRAGEICAVIGNVNRDSKRRPEPFGPEDFMPYIRPPAPPAAATLRARLAHRVVKKGSS